MDKKEIQKKLDAVNKIFREDQSGIIAEIYDLNSMLIFTEIEWGDWKHEHGYCDWIMQENGFRKVGEQITEEDGSDCYSAVHFYKYGTKPSRQKEPIKVEVINQ